jgi:glycosyltransferase involved in cell wall biosynthesis
MVQRGVAPEKLREIPNGHDPARFTGTIARTELRAELGAAPSDVIAISVGRLIELKRHTDLLVAVAELRGRGWPLKLWIVGDGPLRNALEAEASALGLASAVHFLGQREDVPDLLRLADVFVFTSESEGLPNAVIEAALAGCPIVATDIPGVRAIVADSATGLLVPVRRPKELAMAIERTLQDPQASLCRAQAARAMAEERFSLATALQLLYSAYEDALRDSVE